MLCVVRNKNKENIQKEKQNTGKLTSARNEKRGQGPRPKVSDNQNELAATSTSSSSTTVDQKKLTVKELREQINAKGLNPKGLSKMKKTQLLSLLL